MIWSIQEKTGWTHEYILWKESWFNLQIKMADAPRTVRGSKTKEVESSDELGEFLNS